MIADGLVQEVESLRDHGYAPELNALQTTGYVEVFSYFRKEITYERMIELIKRNTRRYAKRQLTWFRRDARIAWFNIQGEEEFPAVAMAIERHFLDSVAP